MSNPLVNFWRKIVGDQKSFVMFNYGTCVVVSGGQGDLTKQAIEILEEWGPKHAGPKGGWVDVKEITDSSGSAGWVVVGEHPDVLAYVAPDEGGGPAMQIGLTGRMKRDKDSQELQVVHVEDKG
jgi:hypothetical protein